MILKVLMLLQARQSWPDRQIISITRGSHKSENLLTSALGSESFASAGVRLVNFWHLDPPVMYLMARDSQSNGEIFFVEFAGAKVPSISSHADMTSEHESAFSNPHSNNEAACFNYKVFSYLRRYSSWFHPSHGLPEGDRQAQQARLAP